MKNGQKLLYEKNVHAIVATQLFIPSQIKKLSRRFSASDYVAPLLVPKEVKVFTFILRPDICSLS